LFGLSLYYFTSACQESNLTLETEPVLTGNQQSTQKDQRWNKNLQVTLTMITLTKS